MAHGTPESVDQMADYLRLVRGGREPSPELIEEMTHNWEAIGGRSPLTDITLQQASALQAQLASGRPAQSQLSSACATGGRSSPTPCARSKRAGARRIVGIPLAPQFSTLSVQKYMDAAQGGAAGGRGFLVRALVPRSSAADRSVRRKSAGRSSRRPAKTSSSPRTACRSAWRQAATRIRTRSPPRRRRSPLAAAFARTTLAYQSAGRTPEPWLGPDLSDLIRDRAHGGGRRRAGGADRICVRPHGDSVRHRRAGGRSRARSGRQRCGGPQSLNTSPTFIRTLAALVAQAVAAPA